MTKIEGDEHSQCEASSIVVRYNNMNEKFTDFLINLLRSVIYAINELTHSRYTSPNMAIQLLINCKLRRSQSSLHTAWRCLSNVPKYISIDHEHQNGIINSSLMGVFIGNWKYITITKVYATIQNVKPHPIIWCHAEDSNPAIYSNLYRPNRQDQHGNII
ncbi:hypothetical protein H8356DRAFT_1348561 [Neocallimastix lanati (nom. inval.)]|nr:hypothetical protein H8356DRAFT_1348561 [Neocallimastix sp. JGI-2020a]